MLGQAYVTVEQADQYHENRLSADTWLDLDETEKIARLLAASDYIDTAYTFSGSKNQPQQLRQFPRNQHTSIPPAVLLAVCELALHTNLTDNHSQIENSVKVGDLTVQYDNTHSDNRRFQFVENALKPFLRHNIGSTKLERG